MDHTKFLMAYNKIVRQNRESSGIGTLGEKTMHAVLKNYFEPSEERQEIKIGTYFADICTGDKIIEIQTRQFNKLRNKLEVFLQEYEVTIVYPVAMKKWLYWLDKESGEVSKGRLSPKKGTAYEVFKELYRIKGFLKHPNLHIHVMLMEVEEYRYLDGWSKDKKKGASRCDRIPTAILDEAMLFCPDDYRKMVPETVSETFDSRIFAKEAHLNRGGAQLVLNILYEVGAVERIGKNGNAFLYKRA